MSSDLNALILATLEDMKGQKIVELDVRSLSNVMDYLIIVTGTSSRHVKALATNMVEELKKKDIRPFGMEGFEGGEWVLVDYGDTVVHAMLPSTRDFYDLEKLWSTVPANRNVGKADS